MNKKSWTRTEKILALTSVILVIGVFIQFLQVRNDIKYLRSEVDELKANSIVSGEFCLPNGYCIYEDESLNIPNVTTGIIIDGKTERGISTYTKGATTTMEFR